jgi:L-asparaginase
MMTDSLSMTEDDRNIILFNCQKSSEEMIVITHGTDTMIETAKLLISSNLNKTIVLTGALVPYTFVSSDGLFNLGSAIALSQTLPHGVYIAMNGKCFHADRVRKDKKTGEFVEIS